MGNELTAREATRQVRLHQWQGIISDRQNSGMTVEEYCNRNGIKKDQYYYWLRKNKEAVIEHNPVVFAELKPSPELQDEESPESAITVHVKGVKIEIHREPTEALLTTVIRSIKNA